MLDESITHLPRSRAEAIAEGFRFYLGRTCPHGHDGLRYTANMHCVECTRSRSKARWAATDKTLAAQRMREWRRDNEEHYKAYRKSYVARKSDRIRHNARQRYAHNPEPKKQAAKAYRERYPDRVKAARQAASAHHHDRWRQYYEAHGDELREKARRRAKRNREKGRIREHRRRSLKKRAPGHFTQQDIQGLMARQGGACACCAVDISARHHIDHIVPLSRGGTNWPQNLQLLCPTCNVRKSNLLPHEFLARRKGEAANGR